MGLEKKMETFIWLQKDRDVTLSNNLCFNALIQGLEH